MMNRRSNPYAASRVAAIDNTESLFSRVMFALAGMNMLTFAGSYVTWNLPMSGSLLLGTFVVSMVLLFAMHFMAHSDEYGPAALVPAGLFAFVEGASLGPVFNYYTDVLGPDLFMVVCLGTGGIMASVGIISTIVNFDYKRVESYLLLVLLGMIVVGVVTVFTGMSSAFNITYSIIGVILFTGFFLVDFMRLRAENERGSNGWGNAAVITTSLYLDQVNLLLYLLRLAAAAKSK
jgi:FtsH-binding integral membrane protein